MHTHLSCRRAACFGAALVLGTPGAFAGDASTLEVAVNTFQNSTATGGAQMTVDAKGPVTIGDTVELPGFAFNVYDVDLTANSVTLTLVADLAKLQITQYDETTFDRYYISLDAPVDSARLSDATHADFAATVDIIAPGTALSTAGAFVQGMASEFSFDTGGLLITIGDGTDLTKIKADGGALTVDF
ncbi:MAG: hypothetical protein AAGA11_11355 [Pseudomonadota bacterium]